MRPRGTVGTHDDLRVGVEVVVVVRTSQLADIDVHAPVVRPIVRAAYIGQSHFSATSPSEPTG